jgi:hypothetical protein
MYDPRDDVREREDGRARVYDQRDRTEHDPRDGLMHDLDLPRGDAREFVVDRDRVYELNGEDSRTLAALGAFRVVSERDLGSDRDPDDDTLDHLRDEGLIRTIALGEDDQAVGRDDGIRRGAKRKSRQLGPPVSSPPCDFPSHTLVTRDRERVTSVGIAAGWRAPAMERSAPFADRRPAVCAASSEPAMA